MMTKWIEPEGQLKMGSVDELVEKSKICQISEGIREMVISSILVRLARYVIATKATDAAVATEEFMKMYIKEIELEPYSLEYMRRFSLRFKKEIAERESACRSPLLTISSAE
jgi:hypothetical protein